MSKANDNWPDDRRNEAEWLSAQGSTRCTRIKRNGDRCSGWAVKGRRFCNMHRGPTQVSAIYRFKTEKASEVFARVMDDPDHLSITGELGLIRTALQMFIDIRSEKAAKSGGELGEADLAMMAALAKDAASVGEACNRIERGLRLHISIEAMDAFLGQLIQVLTEEVADSATLDRIQVRILALEIPTGGIKRVEEYPDGSPEREAYEKSLAFTGGKTTMEFERDNGAENE